MFSAVYNVRGLPT